MIHENSLIGQYQAGLIGSEELFGSTLFFHFCVTCVICVIALLLGILLLTRRHLRTGASTLLAAIVFAAGAAAGLIMDPTRTSDDIFEDTSLGIALWFLIYLVLIYLVYRIIYSKSRFYVRWIILYLIGVIMLIVTAIGCNFSFAEALSTMRVGFMIFTGLMIILPLLPESSGGGGDDFRDLYLDMVGDEY